jgi:hypothetical protein
MQRDAAEHISKPNTMSQGQENYEHALKNSDNKETKRMSFKINTP